MFGTYINKGYSAYSSWTGSIAELVSSFNNPQRNWRILIVKKHDSYDIYQKKSKKLKLIGTLTNSMNTREFNQLRKKVKRATSSGGTNCVLRIGENNVLRKEIQLPKGASDVIEPVIKNQMRRIAPWPEEETCFAYEVNKEKKSEDLISITVIAASKIFLNSSILELKEIGLEPGFIEFRRETDNVSGLILMMSDQAGIKKVRERVSKALAASVVLSLSISAIGFSQLYSKWTEYNALSTELSKSRKKVAQLNRKNADNIRLYKQRTYLITQKLNSPPIVLVLEALTEAIPDTAWLSRMEISKQKLIIAGNARNTTELVKKLESSPMLEKVRFSAPTTRTGIADLETFSIQADTLSGKGKTEEKQ